MFCFSDSTGQSGMDRRWLTYTMFYKLSLIWYWLYMVPSVMVGFCSNCLLWSHSKPGFFFLFFLSHHSVWCRLLLILHLYISILMVLMLSVIPRTFMNELILSFRSLHLWYRWRIVELFAVSYCYIITLKNLSFIFPQNVHFSYSNILVVWWHETT